MPRTISTSPAAPASTTPASASTGSSSRVRRDAVVAARDRPPRGRRRLGLLGELADRGQHRPLDRLADGAVGGVARAAERGREVVGAAERLGGAADDLRQDHARVAAGAHQRGARDLVGERRRGRRPVEPSSASTIGADREREVRARVAVGHGVDVQVVDPAPGGLDRRERAARELEHALPSCASSRTSSTNDLDRLDRQPGEPLDVVGDLRADRRGRPRRG